MLKTSKERPQSRFHSKAQNNKEKWDNSIVKKNGDGLNKAHPSSSAGRVSTANSDKEDFGNQKSNPKVIILDNTLSQIELQPQSLLEIVPTTSHL